MMGGMRDRPTPVPLAQSLALAREALRLWGRRQVAVAVVAALAVAVVIGVATVLIPNPVFGRDIPPVWWNFPVWLVTSALAGLLLATYVCTPGADGGPAAGASRREAVVVETRSSGAITWFAPVQPFLAVAALVLTGSALVWRLRGQVVCPVPANPVAVA